MKERIRSPMGRTGGRARFPREGRTRSNNRSGSILTAAFSIELERVGPDVTGGPAGERRENAASRAAERDATLGRRRGRETETAERPRGVPLWKTEMHFSRGKAIFSPRAACLARLIYNFHCTLAASCLQRPDDSPAESTIPGSPGDSLTPSDRNLRLAHRVIRCNLSARSSRSSRTAFISALLKTASDAVATGIPDVWITYNWSISGTPANGVDLGARGIFNARC